MSKRTSRKKSLAGRRTAPGTSPGQLVADPSAERPCIQVIAYGPNGLIEKGIHDLTELPPILPKWPCVWVNIDGLGNAHLLHQLGQLFDLHPLALEDVLNVYQRPKLEHYDEHLFIVARTVELCPTLETDQFSIFVGNNFLVTFQEKAGDPLDPVRKRLRVGTGALRTQGPGYLAYAILDAIIDHYFPVLEAYGDQLEALEDAVIQQPDSRLVQQIYQVKRDLLVLRKALWPLREVINGLMRDNCPWISDETRLYLRDCYDHIVQILDLVETYREVASGIMEVYLSYTSARMNEIMKVLTIISTVFIPLTFIVGVYGMNFNTESAWNMPELNWAFGYPVVMGIMAVMALCMLFYFYRLGWIFANDPMAPIRESAHTASLAAHMTLSPPHGPGMPLVGTPSSAANPGSVSISSTPPAGTPSSVTTSTNARSVPPAPTTASPSTSQPALPQPVIPATAKLSVSPPANSSKPVGFNMRGSAMSGGSNAP